MIVGEAFDLETLLPPDARLVDPTNPDERVQVTYDDRGLINIDALVTAVKATVDPQYEWPRGLNIHHFYWPAVDYPHSKSTSFYDNPALFRNLPIHRGLVPETFHAWLHLVTEPPVLPHPDVISYRNEAWTIARDLFKTARSTITTEREAARRRQYISDNPDTLKEEFDGRDLIGEAYMQQLLEKNFRGFELHLVRQEALPPEHRLIDLNGSPRKIAKNLGRLVVPRALNLASELRMAS